MFCCLKIFLDMKKKKIERIKVFRKELKKF